MTEEELFEKWKSEQYKDQSTEEKFEFVEHLHNFPQYFKKAFLAGFNAKTQWHDLRKNPEDLPNAETKNYTYIRRRKRYERQFTDYRVIKCFVLCINEKGKITAEVGYFDCNKKCFLDEAEGMIFAWCEIPKFEE